jgi:transcriptional antiterminator
LPFQAVRPEYQIFRDPTNGNVTAAAKKLGISRRTLHRKINEMNQAKPPAARGSTTEDQRSSSSESAR